MKSFNVLDRNQDVHRDYLLEASAGTGKTFSIENLVVRLLIEGNAPFTLEQILVVTFTREATFDLKVRIRKALEQALFNLQQGQGPDYLIALIENGESSQVEKRLRQALFSFDQAQIFTIHSFCSRILRENVFESDMGVTAIQGDQQVEDKQILSVIRDFFRTSLHADFISCAQLDIVLKKHRNEMESLEKVLLNYAAGGNEIASTRPFSTLFEQFFACMQGLKLKPALLMEDFDLLESSYKKMDLSREKAERFAALFEKPITKEDFDILIKDGVHVVKLFDPTNLKVKAKLPALENLHYPDLVEILKAELHPLVEEARSYPMIFARLAAGCQNMIRSYLEEEEKFRFDDLLKMVLRACENETFKEQIQKSYRAAIIDEFQDTDPVQWEIFRSLFHKKSRLYLVGDPKQSIYAFRQADIYTYLEAAKTLGEECHASLDTNFRSQPSLVHALNVLFDQKQTPDWIALPRLQAALPYPEVKASNKIAESSLPDALHFFIAEEVEKEKTDCETVYFFPYIRQEISLLNVALSKIAVLVKDHRQAARLGCYLEENGIPCSLQRSQSLTESLAYSAWKELLQGVLHPRDESAVKKALGGPFFGWTFAKILTLEEPDAFEEVLAHFYQLRRVLIAEGLAAFFEKLMKTQWKEEFFTLAEQLLLRQEGELFYQEAQQIVELLIEEETRSPSNADSLLRYLDTFGESQSDQLKKRRDRSQEAVRILTMHSSKGLEFDFVFALGLTSRTPRDELLIPYKQKLIPVFDADAAIYQAHLQEMDAEKMRQLYVAMTRAKHRLYVPILYAQKVPELGTASPMELFLASFGQKNKGDLYARIQELDKNKILAFASQYPEIGYTLLNETHFSFQPIPKSEKVSLKAPQEINLTHKKQYYYSFTSLAKSLSSEDFSGMQAPHDFKNPIKNRHTLPSGALTGLLIHEIFETLPFETLDENSLRLHIRHLIAGSLFEEWEDVLLHIVQNTLDVDLNGFCLRDIHPDAFYRETEFLYPYDSGYLKGVIDFAFAFRGKYYLIDWKSNWLGTQGSDYTYPQLEASMKKHHYFLQAKIYEEALKRYLQLVDERSFDDCYGGTFYLFLRGLDPLIQGQGVYRGNG